MREFRLGLAVAAIVIGVWSLILANWWTAAAMALLLLGQLLAERDARRRATRGAVPTPHA